MLNDLLVPDLAICPRCDSDACQPLEWSEARIPGYWLMTLVCGNCEYEHTCSCSQDQAEDYDCWLDDCLDEIWASYRLVLRENMSTFLENFVVALNADAILPEDF